MGFLGAVQIIFDVFAGCGIFILLLKLARAPKDDPRLSRGLQILQSKIAILEDLSDRTENQVRGLMALLDQKNIEVQARIDKAGEQVRNVENSIRSSMDVAKIFQDKIPHQEIIERQNTLKYLEAARLANQGASVDQIAQKVDLPLGEIEFIAKVNREQLSFSVEELPPWAQAELAQLDAESTQQQSHPYSTDFNYLANANDKKEYDMSEEISPLASFVNEPQFQPFYPLQHIEDAVAPLREYSVSENKNLSTLKRTQSIIANLDKQFAMNGFDVQEDEPPPPMKTPPPPTPAPILATREERPKMNSYVAPTHVNKVTQSAGSYDPTSIRKVIFPTINSPKANQRF